MQYTLHEQDLRDKYLKLGINQGITQGIKQGKSEGIKQGKTEGIRQTVANFLKAGASLDLISKATGLSEEEILAIQ